MFAAACGETDDARVAAYTDLTQVALPASADPCTDALARDVDGDGDVDLVIARGGVDQVFDNDGGGTFTDTGRLVGVEAPTADLAWADVDGDSLVDLVSVGSNGIELYRDQGGGYFASESGRLPAAAGLAIFAADLDGGSGVDLVVGGLGAELALINDGRGFFVDETPQRLPPGSGAGEGPVDLLLADLSGDGALDLVRVASAGVELLLGEDGVFALGPPLPALAEGARDFEVHDVDGDGALDLFVAAGDVAIWTQSGSGAFVDETRARIPAISGAVDLELADVDRDGDRDLLIVRDVDGEPGLELWLDDGRGGFLPALLGPADVSGPFTQVTAADVSGDGVVDFFICSAAGDRLLVSQPIGGEASADPPGT